jgi:CheY-like chemotaxis protein
VELRKARVELAEAMIAAAETSRPAMQAAGHSFDIALPDETIVLEADIVRLSQVVANILNNAAKYTDNGGRISLSARRVGAEAVITVRDNGVGIPADMLPRVFDMFSQVDRTLNRAQGGLGIGLTLAKALVELHGGRIEAHSRGPGEGAQFDIYLPVLAAGTQAANGHHADAPVRRAAPRRILVVDDNVDAAQSLGMMFSQMGHDVQVAHDGFAALEAGRAWPPDLVVLDISMPGVDGFEVVRRLRQDPKLARSRFIALTGHGQEEFRRRSREVGFDEYIVKPLSHDVLHSLLARHRTK